MSKFSNIIHPSNRVPRFPFVLNRQSEQARGLVGWWPMRGAIVAQDQVGVNPLNTFIDIPVPCALPSGLPGAWTGLVGAYWSSQFQDVYPTDSITLSARFVALTAAADQCVIAYTNGSNFPLIVDLQSSTTLRAFRGDGAYAIASGAYAGLGLETLVTATASGGSIWLYVNGLLQSTATGAGTGFSAGQNVTTNRSGRIDGQLADLRIYNRVLSAPEVWALYDPATRYELYQPLSRRVYFIPPAAGAVYKDASARLQALSGVKTSSSILRAAAAKLEARSTIKSTISRVVAAHAEIIARSTVTATGSRIAGVSANVGARSTVKATSSLLRGASVLIQSRSVMQTRASAWRSLAARLQARSTVLYGEAEVIEIHGSRLYRVQAEDRIYRVPAENRIVTG